MYLTAKTNTEREIDMDYFEAILQDYLGEYPLKDKPKRKYNYNKFKDYRKMTLKNKESGVVSRIIDSNTIKKNITFSDIENDIFMIQENRYEIFLGTCNKVPNSAEKEILKDEENYDDIVCIYNDDLYESYYDVFGITKTYRMWFKVHNTNRFFKIDFSDKGFSSLKLYGKTKEYKFKNIYTVLGFLSEEKVADIISAVLKTENRYINIFKNDTPILTKKEKQILAVIDNAKREKHKKDQNFSYNRSRVKEALKKIQYNPEEDQLFSNKKDIVGKDYIWR